MRMFPEYTYEIFVVCIVPCSKLKEVSSCRKESNSSGDPCSAFVMPALSYVPF
jgi:hypothetical protein